jgi:hypothetical protein
VSAEPRSAAILLLVVALLWSAATLRNAAAATVAARHDAWRQRRDARPRSFDFADVLLESSCNALSYASRAIFA